MWQCGMVTMLWCIYAVRHNILSVCTADTKTNLNWLNSCMYKQRESQFLAAARMRRSKLVAAPTRSSDVLALPDSGARERVPVQPLSQPQTSHRDRARALPHRATDQDLVPEPPHESQEGKDADHGAERAVVVMATAAAAAGCGGAARYGCWKRCRSLKSRFSHCSVYLCECEQMRKTTLFNLFWTVRYQDMKKQMLCACAVV